MEPRIDQTLLQSRASAPSRSSEPSHPLMSPVSSSTKTPSSPQAQVAFSGPRVDDRTLATTQLPDAALSREATSKPCLANGGLSTGVPTTEALLKNGTGPTPTTSGFPAPVPSSTPTSVGKSNIIRRLSSRASRRITTRRRQSSAAPASREGSIGPCFYRRRSDSNTTVPFDCVSPTADSDSDIEEHEDLLSIKSISLDAANWAPSTNVDSVMGGNNMAGPIIPLQIQRGTWLRKVSKKNRSRRVRLNYIPETNKLAWDWARPQKSLHVDEIREIRTGSDVQQYGRDFNIPDLERNNWFSISYTVAKKCRSKMLHLIADDAQTFHLWTTFLDAMLKHRQEAMTSLMSFNDKAIAQYWQRETNKDGVQTRPEEQEVNIAGVMQICQNLHIYSSQSTLQAHFRHCDARRRERLNFAEFLTFVRLMRQRQDVQQIVRAIAAKPELGLTLPEFLTFLREVQCEPVNASISKWEKRFFKYIRKQRQGDSQGASNDANATIYMSESAFVSFLCSPQAGPVVDEPPQYTLQRPMNEYFISSSHNTYLLGRQVAGQSSVEGYIAALARGCRCVEVDCWDGPNGQPQVVHGRTLTTAISFQEVMTTINKHAFVKSSFPLWISLEVHCNAAQQALMVDIMKEAFGRRLVTEPLDPNSQKLPSPSELMERILIKVKMPIASHDGQVAEPSGRRRGSSVSSPSTGSIVPDVGALVVSQSLPQSPPLSALGQSWRLVGKNRVDTIAEGAVPDLLSSSTSDNESESEIGSAGRSTNKTIKILGSLGVYCAGVKFNGFEAPVAKMYNHIFSFMESSFARYSRTKEAKQSLEIHNMRYMMRVYPDSIRFASSNFDPLIYWRRGVQMAALNWQTFDLGTQINHAMFRGGTDSSGYVLKPPELRDIQVRPFNSAIAQGKKERSVVSFTIEVISAQQLMRPANLPASKSIDPFVEVQVLHANDKRDKKEVGTDPTSHHDSPLAYRTEAIRENGFNPVFTGGRFRFKVTTKYPDLIFVRWLVKLASYGESYNNKDGAAIATYTAKLRNLRQGFRTLPLLNHAGDQYLFSTLFCKIDVQPIETRLFDVPAQPPETNKLNRLGGRVFGRGNISP